MLDFSSQEVKNMTKLDYGECLVARCSGAAEAEKGRGYALGSFSKKGQDPLGEASRGGFF